jgi:hypothetical protein
MLLQGQEILTYDNFSFPSPPPFDWKRAESEMGAGMLQEAKDMVALRKNVANRTHGLLGGVANIVQVGATFNSHA